MDEAGLIKLKEAVDAALTSNAAETRARLAVELETALAELKGVRLGEEADCDEMTQALLLIKQSLDTPVDVPERLPGNAQQQALLGSLLARMRATQQFALALSRGDLSERLDERGTMAGSLKSLQASLRHLTWQTEMIARGDFDQKVDFMGEFSTAFNAMVESLAAARGRILEQNEALERVNASLREEISGRLQATARAEIQGRLIEQREQERLQIARDLHDGPLQQIIALVFDLDWTAEEYPDPALSEQLRSMANTARGTIAELREFAGELRPPSLSAFGLKQAISAHCDNFQKKHPRLQIDLEVGGEDIQLPEMTRLALFRIYQETLTNIVKHAGASQVRIELHSDDTSAWMEIADNGRGFELPTDWLELARDGHLGLVGMRERAEAVGGQVEIWSRPGQGTSILVTAPLTPPAPC